MNRPRGWSGLYRALLRLLPRELRDDEGASMAHTFDRLLDDEGEPASKRRRAVHALAALLGVIARERWQALGRRRHDSEGRTTMDRWAKDLRYAFRTLRRAPVFTVGAVALMAVGIGAVTTVFTLVDHVLLRPLPYPAPDRLVTLENGSFPGPMVQRMDRVPAFDLWAAGWSTAATLTGEAEPLRVEQARVTRDFFALFGADAAIGRLLAPDDETAVDRAVLSHAFWTRALGAEPEVIGRTLVVDDERITVIGVAESSFSPPAHLVGASPDLYRPVDWAAPRNAEHDYQVLQVVGRLRPGSTTADAQAGVDAVVAALAEEVPGDYRQQSGEPSEVPVTALQEVTVRGVRTGLGLLLGAVGLLLAVACTNVAHLFLARGIGRAREMSVRRALGAGTSALARQLTLEALVVGLLGGALGTLLAAGGLKAFLALAPNLLPAGAEVTLDLRILGFAAAVSLATALLFGLVPAMRSIRRDPSDGLGGASRARTEGRRLGMARSGMLVAEVALSMILLAGSALLMRSFLEVRAVDPGFAADGLWSVPLTPTDLETPEQYVRAMEEIRASLAAIPEVESAALGLALPFTRTGNSRCCWSQGRVTATGHDGEISRLSIHPVSRDYMQTLGIEVLQGSIWPAFQTPPTPRPVVVTASTARELWGRAEAAVGQFFIDGEGEQWAEVVGVVADHSHFGLDQDMGVSAFLPIEALPFPIPIGEMALRLRSDAAPADLGRTVREAIWRVAPAQPVPTVRSMNSMIDRSTAARRFDGMVFTVFGALALLLAAGGLYGTLLYTVGRRRREMGIRMALGADHRQVQTRVMAGGLIHAAVGVAVGLLGAWYAGRWLESRLWGVAPGDPATLAGAAAALLAVAALASWLPARRAALTNPVETLRAE